MRSPIGSGALSASTLTIPPILETHHSYQFLQPAIAVDFAWVDELKTLFNLAENNDKKEKIAYSLSEIAITEFSQDLWSLGRQKN